MENGTLKVAQIADKQPQPACRFSITATLDGFPIEIQGEGRAGDLCLIVDRLKAIGATPPQVQTSAQSQKSAGAPVCPVHNTPMKEGRRGFFCPKKVGDGYCKETA
jgi:hypothetical protein